MIDVTKIYEPKDYSWYDYAPMIKAFGNVAVIVEDIGYQGDTRVLYDNDGRIGHLIFGWGSCSGCDALRACHSFKDLQELCNELESDILWFDTPQQALDWFLTHDWGGDYSWHADETKKYVIRATEYLRTKSVDPKLQAVCEYTGLSEKAVKALCAIPKDGHLFGVLEKFIVSCVPEQEVVNR